MQIYGDNQRDNEKERRTDLIAVMEACMVLASREEEPERAIAVFLQSLGERIHADRIDVIEKSGDGCCFVSVEWCAADAQPQKERTQELKVSEVDQSGWTQELAAGRCLVIPDVDEIWKKDRLLAAELECRKVERGVICPLVYAGSPGGVVTFENMDEDWAVADPAFYQLCAGYLASLLAHRDNISRLEQSRQYDPLTSLFSMSSFLHIADRTLERLHAGEEMEPQAMICFNIVNFKVYNSRMGFARGDELLRQVGGLIRQVVGTEYVARHDADHFYALVEKRRAREVVRQVHDVMLRPPRNVVEIRAGVYVLSAEDTSAGVCVDRARMALTSMRGNFREYVHFYEPQMETRLTTASYLIAHLDEALRQGWIEVYYQPIVGTFSGKVEYLEALSRWRDPAMGFLSPAIFIPTLEQAHLLHRLDLYVLEQVCVIMRRRTDEGEEVIPVSVNLSRHDLEIADIHEKVNGVLAKYAIPHSMIQVEITESALLDNEKIMKAHLERFHADGYRVWLDDFGSGYSSLGTLQKYEFDLIKVDMQFLREENEKTPVFLRSIITLAKRLRIMTLTEGAETREQVEFLRSIGCAYVQGFYFSRPLPGKDGLTLLQQKGYAVATAEDHVFYREVGQVNVLEPQNPLPEVGSAVSGASTALIVLEVRGRQWQVLYRNEQAERYMEQITALSREPGEQGSESWNFRHRLSEVLQRTDRTAGTEGFDFVLGDLAGRIQAQRIAAAGERRAYLLTGVDFSALRQQMTLREDMERELYSLMEEVELMIPDTDTMEHIYGVVSYAGDLPRRLGLRGMMQAYAQRYVLAGERESWLRFTDPDTVQDRLDRTEQRALNGFFHLRAGNGSYRWLRVSLVEISAAGGHRRCLLLVTRNLVGWNRGMLQRYDTDQQLHRKGDASRIGGENLWDALYERSVLGVFWKDMERRIVGMNRTYLEYLGLTQEEVLGKVLDELPWEGDVEAFRRQEDEVLVSGRTVVSEPVQVLRDGKLRWLLLTRVPIWQEGRITGLLGFFLDITGLPEQIREVQEKISIDPITGLYNQNGLHRRAHELEAEALERGRDFSCIAIQILDLRAFWGRYGAAACSLYLRAIGSCIAAAVEDGDVVCRELSGRFTVLLPGAGRERAGETEKAILRAFYSLREIGGKIPCTVYAMIGSAQYSECADLGQMMATAQYRMVLGHQLRTGRQVNVTRRYGTQQTIELMRFYHEFFDRVHLSDPKNLTALSYNLDGQLYEDPDRCFGCLGQNGRCPSCIARETLQDHRSREILVRAPSRTYYLLCVYVEVNGEPWVLEGVRRVGRILRPLEEN